MSKYACLAAAMLFCAGPGNAVERLTLDIGKVSREGIEVEDLRVAWQPAPGSPLALTAARVTLAQWPEALRNLDITCDAAEITPAVMRCEDASLGFDMAERRWSARLGIHLDRRLGDATLQVTGLGAGAGGIDAVARLAGSDWHLEARTRDVGVGELSALLPGALSRWQWSGNLHAQVTAAGDLNSWHKIVVETSLSELAFSDPAGLRAGEGLDVSATAELRPGPNDWQLSANLRSPDGQIYVDPVFVDIGAHPLDARIEAHFDAGGSLLTVPSLRIALAQLGQIGGEVRLDTATGALHRALITLDEARLPEAYRLFAQPFLLGTPAANLDTGGSVAGSMALGAHELPRLQLTLDGVDIEDLGGGFALYGLDGELNWRRERAGDESPTRLRWSGGHLYGLTLGAAELNAITTGEQVTLSHPLELPVLDGILRINRFELEDALGGDRQAILDAELLPLSLRQLTAALGWPAFSGTLSGVLPELEYRDGVARVGGEFVAQAFGGELRLEGLSVTNPLGAVPEVSADVRLRDLSLEAVTNAFAFGQITGTLEGDIEDLRLVGWQPASFRAWLHTPRRDGVAHRISQRAVENLASLGGAGAAAALSRGFMRFFENFSYDRIGLGCTLRGNVCDMRGLAPDNGGYVIVRGQGLPRIDVVGYSREVSWPVLVQQIIDITRTGPPVVE